MQPQAIQNKPRPLSRTAICSCQVWKSICFMQFIPVCLAKDIVFPSVPCAALGHTSAAREPAKTGALLWIGGPRGSPAILGAPYLGKHPSFSQEKLRYKGHFALLVVWHVPRVGEPGVGQLAQTSFEGSLTTWTSQTICPSTS